MDSRLLKKNRTRAKNESAQTDEQANFPQGQPIPMPKTSGGKWRLTNKLRAAGVLQPGQTIRQYNASLDSDSSAENLPEPETEPGAESIEIESHGEPSAGGFGGLLQRASNALKNDDLPKAKRISAKSRDDFSVLVVSVVTLLVTFAKVEESVKPNGEEIDLFSNHLSGILLRHLPINNKLSADALDLIGIMAATATWYSRVHEDISAGRIVAPRAEEQTTNQPTRSNGRVTDPISAVSPEAGLFLDRVALNSAGAN